VFVVSVETALTAVTVVVAAIAVFAAQAAVVGAVIVVHIHDSIAGKQHLTLLKNFEMCLTETYIKTKCMLYHYALVSGKPRTKLPGEKRGI